MKVGFIGLGTMGLRMVSHIIEAGYETWVVSRSRGPIEKAVQLGAKEALHPQDLASKVDVLLTCLPMPDTIEAVYFGENGIVHSMEQGLIVIDHSTVSPQLNEKQANEIKKRGGFFIDAPISGGPMGAEAGTLTIMCGGEKEAYTKALPILETMGKTIELVGPTGSGSVVKIINNMLVGVHTAALSEAFVMGAKAGVDPDMLYKLLKVSTGHSFMMDRTFELIANRDFEQRFMVDLLNKDMKLAVELADNLNVDAQLGKTSAETIAEVARRGYGKEDVAAIIKKLEEDVQVEVKRIR